MKTLLLHGVEPYHWAIAGAGIGVITLLLLAFTNRRLGISTGYENICSLVVKAPYFQRGSLVGSHSWRLPFLAGLVGGGVLSAALAGGWRPMWELGMFDQYVGWGPGGKIAWMFIGGVFIGFGTRMAGGCTSGHGIFGLSNLEKSGIVATVSFMVAGVFTTNIIYRLILGV